MEQDIYGDILFLIDFSIDFLSLYVCGKLCRRRISCMRLCIAAVLGGIFSVALLFVKLHSVFRVLFALIFAQLMCKIAYRCAGFYDCLRQSAVLCLLNFAMCGGIVAMMTLFSAVLPRYDVMIYGSPETVSIGIPAPYLLIFAALNGALSLIFGRIMRKRCERKTVELKIKLCGKESRLTGFSDSGDLLCEPISGTPCVIVKMEKICGMLPDELKAYISSDCVGRIPKYAEKLRVIPMSTVGKSGMIYAVLPDKMTVDGTEKYAYLALDTYGGEYDGFDALVPSSLL